MRPPEFWKADVSGRDAVPVLRTLLRPISWAYAAVTEHRFRTTVTRRAPIPVICVGNLTVGGAGKTPIARAIRSKLGSHAHTLSRGYGGRVAGPLRVTPDMDAREVGDEPLLHAHDGAAWIARDRYAGALAALQAGAQAIVMDDGFQNATLAKDLSLIVIDAEYGVGNGEVFPAGPLRERLAAGLARADAVIIMHGTSGAGAAEEWLAGFGKPILNATLSPAATVPTGKLVAFAGLARPEKFFATLADLDAEVTEAVPFADHHVYSADELFVLAQMAEERGARLITTEKDAARLSQEWRARVAVLPVTASFENDKAIDDLLEPIRSRMNAAHG